ncbi:porin [Jannaschia aquimarina]|uniref:Porin n=1 Tax=Jannaschia aquimarina TaxID=935700 RepID=A0A0D1DA03_9RHOB|nr:porin [Jannaschia aquimarina]KIT16718.1 Porin [Jannaschia aquimarina]SNS54272.1 outer membrane protein OmpU [Jannaschia aquimarina]
MKNVLFASTALVAFAGAASADITLSGSAEMGISRVDNVEAVIDETDPLNPFVSDFDTSDSTSFHTDIDVTFTMSGETDGGLTFGASIDLDESDDGDAFSSTDQGGEVIFLSGAFGTITMGDTDGALDWALTETLFSNGSIQDDEETLGYNGNAGLDGLYDGQILRYDYSFGAFGVAVSAELDDDDGDDNDDVLGIGFKYDLDLGGTTVALGAGYQAAELADVSVDTWGLSVAGSFGDFSAGISYMRFGNHIPSINLGAAQAIAGDPEAQSGRFLTDGDDTDHVGIGIGYSSGAISVSANYGQYDHDDIEVDGIGLTAGYDLGGGAEIQFGYGRSDVDVAGTALDFEIDTVSLGVAMSF